MTTVTGAAKSVRETNWRALTYFNSYRLFTALLFVTLYWVGQLPQPLGVYDHELFAMTVHAYLVATVLAFIPVHYHVPRYALQVAGQVLLDVVAITMLMYASSGLSSGFGMLLVITVAGGALLRPGKIAILFAAVAAIAVLGHEAYTQLHRLFPQPNYTHAGFLGITFFLAAFISGALASRVETSEALAERRAIDLRNLSRLNEHIVRHMQSGVMVLDDALRINLVNDAARRLLVVNADPSGRYLGEVMPGLADAVSAWIQGAPEYSMVLPGLTGGLELQASFSRLKTTEGVDILVFLEDVAVLRQRAQQMKLASLGRLTASIAHEVRNPLGAISHASQLLGESCSDDARIRRLTNIIEENSRRVNGIVENILSASRRSRSEPIIIALEKWLQDFVAEFTARNHLPGDAVVLEVSGEDAQTRMDADQLYRVLWNLCENGIRYSRGKPLLRIRCVLNADAQRFSIEVEDTGPGIDAQVQEQLFEPFFTTEAGGTGLGLYLARELCEANQASLQLVSSNEAGSKFRILFSPHGRQHFVG